MPNVLEGALMSVGKAATFVVHVCSTPLVEERHYYHYGWVTPPSRGSCHRCDETEVEKTAQALLQKLGAVVQLQHPSREERLHLISRQPDLHATRDGE